MVNVETDILEVQLYRGCEGFLLTRLVQAAIFDSLGLGGWSMQSLRVEGSGLSYGFLGFRLRGRLNPKP